MRARRLVCLVLVGAIALSIAAAFPAVAFAQANEDEVKKTYREGMKLFDDGKFAEAYEAIEKALRMNPSNDLLMYLRDEAGYARLHAMMAQGGDLKSTAHRILELAKGAGDRIRKSADEIAGYVKKLESENFDERWDGILHLVAVGPYAAPQLIDLLKDEKNDGLRTQAIITLVKMSDDAVLPLIEALNSKSQIQRQCAAIALGDIKDVRAQAELLRVVGNAGEAAEVKAVAAVAVEKIAGKPAADLGGAKEAYVQLAEKYYLSHPSVMRKIYHDYILWKWDEAGDKLTWKEVPDFSLNEELAKEACYDAIAIDPNYEAAWPLLASAYLQQYKESQTALEAVRGRAKAGEMAAEEVAKLEENLKGIEKARLFGKMVGKRYLYMALDRALTDDNANVAVACLDILKEAGEGEDLPVAVGDGAAANSPEGEAERKAKLGYPVVAALVHADKRVRYAAAEALVSLNPRKRFLGAERVVPVLAEALSEVSVRTVLVIDPDSEMRNRLKAELLKMGYFPTEASNGIDGILKAKNFPNEDAIILDAKTAGQVVFAATVLKKDVVQTVYDSLRDDVRSKGIPIVVLATADGLEQAKGIYKDGPAAYLAKSATYLAGDEDRNALKDALGKLFASDDAQKDGKARAQQVVESAAGALVAIDANNSVYNRVEAVAALVGNLNERPDSTRAIAARALGRVGDPSSIDALTKVFGTKENDKSVRVAAARGLAGVFRNSHSVASDPVFQTLKAGVMEEEIEISAAAAEALGNAALTPAQQKEVFEARRY
ncbi:MAG: hypothetical protein HYZ53_21050 [Planctomycetes bacterium]|nr:hypothetical protein [Planctomycetota bacterium]